MPVPVLQELLVPDGEERPAQRCEDGQLVVRPLDGGQRGAQRLHLLAVVERASAHQQMTDAARLPALPRTGRVTSPANAAVETPEEKGTRDAFRHRHACRPSPSTLRHGPAALVRGASRT